MTVASSLVSLSSRMQGCHLHYLHASINNFIGLSSSPSKTARLKPLDCANSFFLGFGLGVSTILSSLEQQEQGLESVKFLDTLCCCVSISCLCDIVKEWKNISFGWILGTRNLFHSISVSPDFFILCYLGLRNELPSFLVACLINIINNIAKHFGEWNILPSAMTLTKVIWKDWCALYNLRHGCVKETSLPFLVQYFWVSRGYEQLNP